MHAVCYLLRCPHKASQKDLQRNGGLESLSTLRVTGTCYVDVHMNLKE